MFGHAAVVLEGLGARRLLVHARHRDVADLQKFRSGEERHVRRIVVERVDDAALVDDDRVQTAALQFDAAGEAGGSGADDDGVETRKCAHSLPSTSAVDVGERLRQRGGIFAAAFRHIGTAAAFASNGLRERAHQFAGLNFCVRSFVTAATIETAPSSIEARTTTADCHLLRSVSARVRICCAVETIHLRDQIAGAVLFFRTAIPDPARRIARASF